MNWHTRLKDAREAQNIGKSDFARRVGVSPAAVTMWENESTKTIDAANLLRACRVLSVDPEWILDGAGPERRCFQRVTEREGALLRVYRVMDATAQHALMTVAESLAGTVRQ